VCRSPTTRARCRASFTASVAWDRMFVSESTVEHTTVIPCHRGFQKSLCVLCNVTVGGFWPVEHWSLPPILTKHQQGKFIYCFWERAPGQRGSGRTLSPLGGFIREVSVRRRLDRRTVDTLSMTHCIYVRKPALIETTRYLLRSGTLCRILPCSLQISEADPFRVASTISHHRGRQQTDCSNRDTTRYRALLYNNIYYSDLVCEFL